MRLLFAALLLSLISVPIPSLARDVGAEAEAEETLSEMCRDGGYECMCNPSLSTSSTEVSETNCESFCERMGDGSYRVTCETNGGATKNIYQGNVTFDTSGEENTTVSSGQEKSDAIIPELNVDIPGLEFSAPVQESDHTSVNFLGEYIVALYQWVIGAAAIIAVVMMMIGGLQYAMARGKAKYIDKAKTRITNAITGLVLLLAAYNIAFLINPDLVVFDSLNITYVARQEYFPPEGEDTSVSPNLDLTGQTVPLKGTYIVADASDRLDPETLAILESASESFYINEGYRTKITSSTRNLQEQASIFYNKCLANASNVCEVPVCNPAGSSVITKNGSSYTLVGSLAGETNADKIVAGIVANANYGSCPHTSAIAVDAWCDDGGGNYQHDPACQAKLAQTMITAGFCRLKSEPWHFEKLDSKVSTNCSTSYNDASYTTSSGTTYVPTAGCSKWDFKKHVCVN